MKLTADLNMVKKINKSLVLEQIRQRAPISRALIAERTGLTKATVSSLVQELIDSHLVHEIGAGKSRGGRRPMMLHFNSNAGHAIGIDLGVKSFTAVLVDLNGAVIAEEVFPPPLLLGNRGDPRCQGSDPQTVQTSTGKSLRHHRHRDRHSRIQRRRRKCSVCAQSRLE